MVPKPQPDGGLEVRRLIFDDLLKIEHRATSAKNGLKPRSIDFPPGPSSTLFIFVGVLITLCVAAPILAYLRERRRSNSTEYLGRTRKAVSGLTAELASVQQDRNGLRQERDLVQVLLQEEENLRTEQVARLISLQNKSCELEQNLRRKEEALSEQHERATNAEEEAQELRELRQTTLGEIQLLQNEMHIKDGNLKTLQRKFNYIEQEYRGLQNEMQVQLH